MKQILNLTFFSIFTIIIACGNQYKKTDNNSTVNKETEEFTNSKEISNQNEETPIVSFSTIKSSVLILNMENEISVNINTVNSKNIVLLVLEGSHYEHTYSPDDEFIKGNDYGLFKITPKKAGKITLVISEKENKGEKIPYAFIVLNVVNPQTTIEEIFKMN